MTKRCFKPLYCPDNGSPNKPVNILLSLEFLKHLHNYTDEETLEQYYFNYQVNYALGQRNLGGLYIAEQTVFDPVLKKRVAKKGLRNFSKIPFSPLDTPDATFRRKGNKDRVGYTYTLTETCAEENPVQFVTDYTVDKNVKTDPETLQERLSMIKEKTGLTDLYEDGGFYSPEVQKLAEEHGVTMHYTNLTGRKPAFRKTSAGAPLPLKTIRKCSPVPKTRC